MTSSTGRMPANFKPTTFWYMPGICKGPSGLTWIYRLPKTWHMWGIHFGTKINEFLLDCQILVYIWHTIPQTAQCECRWEIFADGTLAGVWLVYDVYHRYTSQKIQMTANDRAGMCLVSTIYQTYTPLYQL